MGKKIESFDDVPEVGVECAKYPKGGCISG